MGMGFDLESILRSGGGSDPSIGMDEDELRRRVLGLGVRPPSSLGTAMAGTPAAPSPSAPASSPGPAPASSGLGLGRPTAPSAAPSTGLGKSPSPGMQIPDEAVTPGPGARRYQDMVSAGEPQLHGIKKVLDVIGQIAAPGIEQAIPGTPGHYRMELGRAAGAAKAESGLQDDYLGRIKPAQEGAADLPGAEARYRNAAADWMENRPTTAAGGGEKHLSTYVNDQGKQVDVMQKADGSIYERPSEGTVKPAQSGGFEEAAYQQELKTRPTLTREQFIEEREGRVADRTAASQDRTWAHQRENQDRLWAHQAEVSKAKTDAVTNATKTMIESAPKVKAFADRINQLVQQQEGQLGPAMGRWSEFMAGKVGAPNPQFTQLRTDVMLLQTLLMRMHVGARGGEYLMQHFQSIIDAGKQDPANMYAAIQEIGAYADMLTSGSHSMTPGGTGGAGADMGGGGAAPVGSDEHVKEWKAKRGIK